MRSKSLYLFFIQFLGYLWHLSVFVVVIPYLLVFLSQGLEYYLFRWLLKVDPELLTGWVPESIMILLALIALSFGLLIMIESAITLYRHSGAFPFTLIPHAELTPRELATSGWYARVRHPMLLAYLIVLFGLGLYLRSVTMIFWWVPLFILILLEYTLLKEEKELEKWFGQDYKKYQEEVPALIPRIKLNK